LENKSEGDRPADPTLEGESDPRFRLDQAQLPRSFELDLSDELLQRLAVKAEKSNRSMEELIEHFICQALADQEVDAG